VDVESPTTSACHLLIESDRLAHESLVDRGTENLRAGSPRVGESPAHGSVRTHARSWRPRTEDIQQRVVTSGDLPRSCKLPGTNTSVQFGAYQAGVFEALDRSGLEPDWTVGTSIGAINAALIAGNRPHRRLEHLDEFWARVGQRWANDAPGPVSPRPDTGVTQRTGGRTKRRSVQTTVEGGRTHGTH